MSATNHLMPSNARPLLRELAEMGGDVSAINPTVIETLWDAWRIPAKLLPWLAWAMSVDHWNDGWPEVTKRKAIADAPYYHRIKGTRRGVEMALDLMQRPYAITEWWERTPHRRRGTFAVLVDWDGTLTPRALIDDARTIVTAAKPKSRAAIVIAGMRVATPLVLAAATIVFRTVTLQPFRVDIPPAGGVLSIGGVLTKVTTITIEATP